eukprot:6203803-Pleurochrysis_carterae.AAC.2
MLCFVSIASERAQSTLPQAALPTKVLETDSIAAAWRFAWERDAHSDPLQLVGAVRRAHARRVCSTSCCSYAVKHRVGRERVKEIAPAVYLRSRPASSLYVAPFRDRHLRPRSMSGTRRSTRGASPAARAGVGAEGTSGIHGTRARGMRERQGGLGGPGGLDASGGPGWEGGRGGGRERASACASNLRSCMRRVACFGARMCSRAGAVHLRVRVDAKTRRASRRADWRASRRASLHARKASALATPVRPGSQRKAGSTCQSRRSDQRDRSLDAILTHSQLRNSAPADAVAKAKRRSTEYSGGIPAVYSCLARSPQPENEGTQQDLRK